MGDLGKILGDGRKGEPGALLPYLSLPREASFAMATSPLYFQLLPCDTGPEALVTSPPPSVCPDPKSVAFCGGCSLGGHSIHSWLLTLLSPQRTNLLH